MGADESDAEGSKADGTLVAGVQRKGEAHEDEAEFGGQLEPTEAVAVRKALQTFNERSRKGRKDHTERE